MLKDLLINNLTPGEVDRTGERVDGKATIIGKLGYNWIAVLDADYRDNFVMYVPEGYVPTMHGVTQTLYSNPTTGMSAAELLATVPVDFLTSEQTNYAYLGAATSSLPNLPVSHCTGISINGTTASMPNIQTLCFVWSRRDFVDEHDPTLSSYPTQGLTSWGSDSFTKAAGSSTQIYAGTAGTSYFMVDSSGSILINGYGSGASTQIIPILEIPAYEDRTGERIDNKATIIGKLGDNWIAVLDAAYRANETQAGTSTTSGLPATSGSLVVTPSSTENTILTEQLFDIHNSKWNTDYRNQVNLAENFPAAKMCYDITIDGKHAQLPNVQALAFVYSKKDYVDANDPTAPSNTAKKLSNWGFGNSSVCSSTAGDSISSVVALDLNGRATAQNKNSGYYGVIPILEIPLYKDRTGERVDDKATIAGKLGNYWIAVLDAQYRDLNLKWGKYDVQLSGLANTVVSLGYLKKGFEEASILSSPRKDMGTSRKNTSYLMTQNTGIDSKGTIGVPAAAHCFSHTILGTNAQMPNLQTACFLYSKSSFIDANDPTVGENHNLSLSSNQANIWSSTQRNTTVSYVIISSSGLVDTDSKDSSRMACPILEIPLWCDDNYK